MHVSIYGAKRGRRARAHTQAQQRQWITELLDENSNVQVLTGFRNYEINRVISDVHVPHPPLAESELSGRHHCSRHRLWDNLLGLGFLFQT